MLNLRNLRKSWLNLRKNDTSTTHKLCQRLGEGGRGLNRKPVRQGNPLIYLALEDTEKDIGE